MDKAKMHLPIQKCCGGLPVSELSDIELLAIALGTGGPGCNVIDLAASLYSRFGGLAGIRQAGLRELAAVDHVGLTKAIRIHSALETGRRVISPVVNAPTVLDTPQKVWLHVLPSIAGLKQEQFRLFTLNQKNHLLRDTLISLGTLSEAIVHPREIFREAIREAGASIIVCHNHPSGVTTPSREDIAVTSRIAQAGKIVGIDLLDHVIVSDNSYNSLREGGYF
jgi:DNA repair protein RadC